MTTPGNASVDGVALAVPDTSGILSGSGSANPYSLDNPSQPFSAGALGVLLHVPVDGNGKTTPAQFLAAFAAADPSTKSQIQAQLVNAGYYGTSPNLTYGVVSNTDLTSMAKALNVAGQVQAGIDQRNTAAQEQANVSGQKPTVETYDFSADLSGDASRGQAYGVQSAISARLQKIQQAQASSAQQTLTRVSYDKDYIDSVVDNVSQKLLGRNADEGLKSQVYAEVGTKANSALVKAQGKAAQLDALAKETASADQRLEATLGGTAASQLAPGNTAPKGVSDPNAFIRANQGPDTNVDQFLTAYAATGDQTNPFGFTPSSWATYARQSGLGADADPSNVGNQRVVAKWLAMSLLSKYGSWGAVTAGFLGGPSAAAQYAAHPDSTQWQSTGTGGTSVAGKINAIAQNLPSPANADLLPSEQQIVPGSVVGSTSAALGDQPLSAQPQVVDQVTQDPSASAAADIKRNHPDEYQAHNLANTFASFLGLLGGVGAANVSGYGSGGTPS